jgi:hypothetical protein
MRALLAAFFLFFAAVPAAAQGNLPVGQLPQSVQPLAYRLDLTIDPSRERFAGKVEIDVELRERASAIYMHGRDLRVSRVVLRSAGGTQTAATWNQVNPVGLVRVDFAAPVAAGRFTLVIDYDAAFQASSEGSTAPRSAARITPGPRWSRSRRAQPSLRSTSCASRRLTR